MLTKAETKDLHYAVLVKLCLQSKDANSKFASEKDAKGNLQLPRLDVILSFLRREGANTGCALINVFELMSVKFNEICQNIEQ